MDWDKLRAFHAAAETGSLTAAGTRLGVSQSAVSRQIAALEEQVGVPLFQRHARGLVLTGAGLNLHGATTEMQTAASGAESALRDAMTTPQGELTVTAPVAFGTTWLTPRLNRFRDTYPDVRLKLLLDDREYDLLKLEAECAIRLWAPTQADLIQRKLMTVGTSLYASQAYLDRYGTPAIPADLDAHEIIVYGHQVNPMREVNWAQRVGRDDRPPRVPALTVNSVVAMVRAAEAGIGVADLPDYMIREGSPLIKVLSDVRGPEFELFFIYPSDLRKSKRISVFRDFLVGEIARFVREAQS